jgi:hypothetical protein
MKAKSVHHLLLAATVMGTLSFVTNASANTAGVNVVLEAAAWKTIPVAPAPIASAPALPPLNPTMLH